MIADMRTTATLVLLPCIVLAQGNRTIAGSPSTWPDQSRYLALEMRTGPGIPLQTKPHSGKAMIVGETNPFAVHAGLETLKRGGSAADAVLTASLAQIALNAGATVSYAGILTAVYYDANSGKVYSLNAGWNTPRNETDPFSIPLPGIASGRTALIPGFMAGVQALHERFGRRPFAELFEPSIWLADHGFSLSPVVSGWCYGEAAALNRLEETRQVFQKGGGSACNEGDIFRQSQLAQTLQHIASQGAQYMYVGDWAHRFVKAVRREGGKITMEDMASYRALWSEPAHASYHGYDVTSLGLPSLGSLGTLSGLLLAQSAKLSRSGDYLNSADALYKLIQIARIEILTVLSEDSLRKAFPKLDLASSSRLSPTTTKALAAILQNDNWLNNILSIAPTSKPTATPNHSSGVVAVDEQGNVAALVHTCNCMLWGTTGIFVDGISVPDAANYQQAAISRTEPGGRLPDSTIPVIVLRNQRPVLASSTIGSASLLGVTLQNLINVLDLGMDPQSSVDRPNFQGPFLDLHPDGTTQPQLIREVLDRGFPDLVVKGVKKRGQNIYEGRTGGAQSGYWIGIQIDPKNRALSGGATRKLNSFIEGY
jgi:gamma-glutamyltranspeptidase/glutathione hydrolase